MGTNNTSGIEVLIGYTQKDMQFAKHKQWTLPYYVLLVFGAVFALSGTGKNDVITDEFRWFLVVAIYLFQLFGIVQLIMMNKAMVKYRKRLYEILDKLPEGNIAKDVLLNEIRQKGKKNYLSFWRDKWFLIPFSGVICIAFLFLVYLILPTCNPPYCKSVLILLILLTDALIFWCCSCWCQRRPKNSTVVG